MVRPETGPEFTSRGDRIRNWQRRTDAWPVQAVTATVVDPATGEVREKVVRKAHVKGPDYKLWTYEDPCCPMRTGTHHRGHEAGGES